MKQVKEFTIKFIAADGKVFQGPSAKQDCKNYENAVIPKTKARSAIADFLDTALPDVALGTEELQLIERVFGAVDRKYKQFSALRAKHKLGKLFTAEKDEKINTPKAKKPSIRELKEDAKKSTAKKTSAPTIEEPVAKYAPGQVVPKVEPTGPYLSVKHGPNKTVTKLPAKLGMTVDDAHIAVQNLQRPIHDITLYVGGRGTIIPLPTK